MAGTIGEKCAACSHWLLGPAIFERGKHFIIWVACFLFMWSLLWEMLSSDVIQWCHHESSSDAIMDLQWCHFLFLQIGLKLVAFRLKFFLPKVRVLKIRNKIGFRYFLISFEVFDAMVVVISWILDIASLWAHAVVSGCGQQMCSSWWVSAWCIHTRGDRRDSRSANPCTCMRTHPIWSGAREGG